MKQKFKSIEDVFYSEHIEDNKPFKSQLYTTLIVYQTKRKNHLAINYISNYEYPYYDIIISKLFFEKGLRGAYKKCFEIKYQYASSKQIKESKIPFLNSSGQITPKNYNKYNEKIHELITISTKFNDIKELYDVNFARKIRRKIQKQAKNNEKVNELYINTKNRIEDFVNQTSKEYLNFVKEISAITTYYTKFGKLLTLGNKTFIENVFGPTPYVS